MYDRDPITGPVGVVLCGGGGALVGFGAGVVGSGCVGCGGGVLAAGADEEGVEADDGCESLMAPPLGRSAGEVVPAPWSIGAPLGRSVSAGWAGLLDETAAFFVSCPGGWLVVVLQAAQTRAAATAVAAALAGATVPRIGMDATVSK